MLLGSQIGILLPNYNSHRGRRDPPTHRQHHYTTNRGQKLYSNPVRQQFPSHIQSIYRTKQLIQDQTNTGNQPYITQDLAYNI